MKQVTQRLRDGRIEVLEVPEPTLAPHGVLVDVRASLVSAGTERSKVAAGRAGLIGKARARPEQVAQVIEKARRDGLRETTGAVRARLNAPSPLGYSAAGVVLSVGELVRDLTAGDRVACGGGEAAVHAEIDSVPGNLCVRLPTDVSFEAGAFATVGSVALHGVRQADLKLGERAAVIGLGLVGRLTGQLLRAAGCSVIGIDLSREAVDSALAAGDIDVGLTPSELSGELPIDARECDAVLIAAAAASSDPVELAARLCRDRGRVVVVGDVIMALPRAPYYGKELELRMSRSYGPGRYDREYEERGLDYPIGYVRWTERRNMAAFVDLLAANRIDVESLISERVPVEEAPRAYEQLLADNGSPLGLVLTYGQNELPKAARIAPPQTMATTGASVIGTGSFAQRILIPALRSAGFQVTSVASHRGLSARATAERFDIEQAVGLEDALADPEAGLVVIATRHSMHADLAVRALQTGRAVFVEKPPALNEKELERLVRARAGTGLAVAVGFNRRHAPLALHMRDHLRGHGPLEISYSINAGSLPPEHWLNDPVEGGGRLLGEGCHFVDFVCWLVGELPDRVGCVMHAGPDEPLAASQRFAVTLGFPDGSLATVLYSAAGSTALSKERIEAHAGGRSTVLDDFRHLLLAEGRRRRRRRDRRGDKGHVRQFHHLRRVLDGDAEISDPDPLATMAVTLRALRTAESGKPES